MASATPFPFLRLPLELREQVYSEYFNPASRLQDGEYGGGQYRFEFDVYLVNRQVHEEAEAVFRRENVFVRIETPWPTAVNHISQDGLVPIVAAGPSGKKFRRHHQLVEISAPVHQAHPEHVIIVLLDDLDEFYQVWFYSTLSYPALNEHLRTTFTLQDPYYPADPKPIPIALQKKLLLPFEKIKGLYQVEVDGYDDDVKRELERRMKEPVDSVRKCCEDCAELMARGDADLAINPQNALQLYVQAFKAIHIIITGRARRVLGDPFFHAAIEGGRFNGQSGTTVRIMLRIKLVSCTVAAYIKLQQWEEAAFWGMRSIRIMREAMESEFEDFLTEFVGAEDVGLLYLRTAIAMRKMEEYESLELAQYGLEGEENSERLFGRVKKYLKGRSTKEVRKEMEEAGVEGPVGWLGQERDVDRESMMHMNEESEGEGSV